MKIFFVRHGQTLYNKDDIITGTIDIPLISEGIEQIKKMAGEIPDDFSVIYSSDLIRCRQTTDILNEKLNLPIIFDTRLRGRHFGSLEGTSWKDFDPALKEKDRNQQYDYHFYGGESVEDVKKRVVSFVADVQNMKKDKILVITSGGIIRLLHNMLNGAVHDKIHNSSIHEFDFPDTINLD